MTSRAPLRARISAVAAPRPEADPVTIAHRLSLAILMSFPVALIFRVLFSEFAAPCKSSKLR